MNLLGFRCVLCGGRLALARHGLCSRCNRLIERFPYCGSCGAPLAVNARHCGRCLRHEPGWDRLVVIGRYAEPLSVLIHRFKFQHQFWLDRTLARLMLLAIIRAKREHGLSLPEAILPVPLHHFRQWRRGYNQTALLARYLSRWLDIPCDLRRIERIKRTPSQRGLTAAARRSNLKNAFRVNSAVPYRSVALLDDVITTGSTLNEISRQLRKQGVQHIQAWGVARV
ncbi:DNA utilization protein GntX [Actinobacillus succinogenes]|uniref:Competence protein F n=1 Tax=Actinobacillus succinogenes (strain ATCC 55618 / DSM 22257 / CCUG 43843 / 130Z) TaxID=339671 RepID=A6VL24_ACTSZ|nr:DNA utilization protein GntX [Actinobacillus succinogenes]ABR73671.1 competence protein F [Actinobacillus succinogenes 130Z]PHI41217.1 DNA utilization protein GntX [Actinobacillus succinogenes]